MQDAPCSECARQIRDEQTYGRKPAGDDGAQAGCVELACLLGDWLHGGTITYAAAWRRWTELCNQDDQRRALSKGMRLAAEAAEPIDIFTAKHRA